MKKIISLLLTVVMLLSLTTNMVFAENIVNDNIESDENYNPDDWIDDSLFHEEKISLMSATKNRYTILVLDVSGSMGGTQMERMKEASIYFCQEMIKARGNNSVAIVKFGSSSSLACGFTDDVSALTSTINNLSSGGGTDTAAGLRKARETYDNLGITDITERNVILISDGEPNSQSEAKAAFNEMSNDCNVYTLGYRLSSGAISSMNALQNCGFYNATDTDSIQSNMTKIIEAILAGTIGSVYNLNTNSNNVTVYGNQKSPSAVKEDYKVLDNAKVVVDGTEYFTNASGIVQIPSVTSGSIKISKEGYVEKNVTAASVNESKKVYLQKDEGDSPIINSVMIGNTDVLTSEYVIDLTSKNEVTLKADVYWKKGTYSKLNLVQDSTSVAFTDTTLTTVLSDKFDISQDIYISATNSEGFTTRKKLMFTEGGAIPDCLDGAKLSFNSKINLTMPKSFPFVGGATVSAGLDKAITDAIPVQISVDKNKVYVSIGIDIAEYTRSDSYATNSSTKSRAHVLKSETQTAVDKIKDAFDTASKGSASAAAKKIKNLKQTYKTAMKYPQGSFGFSADFTLLGFIEGYVDSNGKLVTTSGGIILNPSVGFNWSGQAAIGPVPVYWEAAVSAEIEAKGNLYQNAATKAFTPEAEISGEIAGSIGGGVGLNKVLSIGGGGGVAFEPLWLAKFNTQDYFKLDASLNAYFKVVVGWLEYRKQWDTPKATLLEYPSAKLMSVQENTESFEPYDISNYEIQDREYAKEPSVFNANSVQLFSEKTNSRVFKSNVYTNSDPQLVKLKNNRFIAVWLDDDIKRNDINRTALTYSYYNGSTWSNPQQVENDGTADFAPEIKVIGDIAYLVWQDEKKDYSESDSTDTICSGMEITIAQFNEDKSSFDIISSTDNSYMDYMPTLYANNNDPAVLWIRNTDNDIFGATANNSIISKKINSGTENVLVSGIQSVGALSGSLDGDFAYHVDTDGDLNTISDKEIYLNGSQLTTNTVADLSPVFDDEGNLYYYSDGKLINRDINGNYSTICETMQTDNYKLIQSVSGEKAFIYEVSDGLSSDIYANTYNVSDGTWGGKVRITNDEKFLHGFGAVIDEESSFTLIANLTEIVGDLSSEEPYGKTNLVLYSTLRKTDVAITDVIYNTEMFVRDSDCFFDVCLKNNSSDAINEYTISVFADGDLVDSYAFNETILSGNTKMVEVVYAIPDDFISSVLSFEVSISDDEDSSNNSVDVELSYEDISVENIDYSTNTNGETIISADIVNRGYGDGEKVVVSLTEGTADGKVVDTKTVAVSDFLDSAAVSFCVNSSVDDVYYINIDVDDESVSNNENYVVIENDYYKIVDGGAVIINGSAYNDKKIIIPSQLGGYPVVKIDDGAYDSCSNAESIVIPDSVKEIGDYAFSNCEKLKTITIPKNVEKIGEHVFDKCTLLESIKVSASNSKYFDNDGVLFEYADDAVSLVRYPAGKTGNLEIDSNIASIFGGAFDGCTELKKVAITGISESFQSDYAFANCSGLESIVITGDMRTVGDGMFSNCSSLKNVKLPDNIVSVGLNAFRNCSRLKEIEIGSKVETIAQGAFYGCIALEKMSIPFAGGAINSNGFLGYIFGANSYNENANYVPSGLKEVILTNKNATLQSYAFYNCKNITTIEVNNETVGSHVFNGCSSLTDVIFTYKVITINSPFSGYSGDAVLSGYSSTATETYANNNSGITFSIIDSEIPHEVYKEGTCGYDFTWQLYYDHVLELSGTGAMPNYSAGSYGWYPYNNYIYEVVINEGVTSVGANAFYGNTSIKTVTLPNTLKSIKSRAFYNNTSLNDVSIPSYVTAIDSEAFRNCTSLTDIIIGENVKTIGSDAFSGNIGLTEITLPDTVTTIAANAFYGCLALSKVHLSDSLSSIGDSAFGNCTALENIYIPYKVTSINNNAFTGHIATFTIFGYTDSYAEEFANDNGLPFEALDSTIPDEVRASGVVGTDIEWELTYGGVLRITGAGAMPSYSTGSYGWYPYRNSIKSVSISNITGIGNNAFNGYSKLKTITMTSSVKRLGTETFRNCSSLSNVTLSNQLEHIGAYAFNGCTALKEIYIPATVIQINEFAFYGCTQLSKVTLNENLSTISSNAFGNCTAINSIEIPYTAVNISPNAFANHIADMKIIGYRDSCAHDYAIENDIAFEALMGTIPEEIRASGVIETDIEWTLTYGGVLTISGIGGMPNYSNASNYSFYSYSTNIKSVVIEKGVLSVGNNAFNGYTKLRNISLPEGLLRIGTNAFYNCKLITGIVIPDTVTEVQAYAFYKCSELGEVEMSKNIRTIGEYAFSECIMLPELILPYTIVTIHSTAFNNHVSDFILKGYAGTYAENYAKEQNIPFESIDSVVPDVERAKGTFGTDFAWTLSYNGTLTITGTGTMPSYSNASNYGWYNYRQYITNAVIDKNITSVGNCAFEGFTNLTKVIMNDNLRQIGDKAFSGCSNLTEVIFPEKLNSIGVNAFNNCIRLADVKLPIGLATIYEYAFNNCTAIQSIEIPYTTVNIHTTSFNNTLAALVIKGQPSTYVEDFAKENGIIFEKISDEIPDEIYINGTTGNNYEWTLSYGGVLTITGKGSMLDSSSYPWHSYTNYIRTVIVNEGATTIGSNAFASLPKLKTVYLPGSVRTINSSAFRYDVSLENVYMSSGVGTLGAYAFSGCTKLSSITLPDTVTTLNTGAFENCVLLENIVLSKKLSKINDNVFSNCTELKEIMIPETVSYISTSAFNNHILAFIIKGYVGTYAQDYAEKNNINFAVLNDDAPEGVYVSGTLNDFEWSINYTGELRVKGKGTLSDNSSSAWNGYSSYIKSIVVEDGITGLGSYTFNGLRNVKTVKLAKSVKSIGVCAFDGDTSLCNIDMGQTETIGAYAFRGCSSLENVKFPDTLKIINARAFENCNTLKSINIPIGTDTISEYAFRNCSCLEYAEIPYTVTNVGNGIFADNKSDFVIRGYDRSYIQSYAGSNGLIFECIAVATDAVMLSGTLETDFTWTLTYSGELIIDGIGAIPDSSSYPWHQYSNIIKKLTVNDGVTGLGNNLCKNFVYLTELNISDDVKTIGSYAFAGCTSLECINLPRKLINISARAFENCYELEDIYISEALKNINDYAFNNCSGLIKVYYSGNKNNWNSITIGTNNMSLQNAEIEYNATDINYLFMGYKQSQTSVSAKIRKINGSIDDIVVLATYSDNGKLIEIVSQNVLNDGLIELTVPFDNEQTAKCFVWNKNMKSYIDVQAHEYAEASYGLQDVVLETPHDYYNSMDVWYTYQFDYEAESIDIEFSSATFTEGCDYIYIYDWRYNLIGTYSGDSLAGVTVNIPGNTVKIRFTSDGSGVYYGFKTDSIYVNR